MWTVITPTNRPEENLKFLDAWDELFTKHKVHLIIMQDSPKPYPELVKATKDKNYQVTLLTWKDIKAKYIPQQTDMVRSWAMYYAWKNKLSKYVLTLDDDTRPSYLDVFEEYEREFEKGAPFSEFLSVGAMTSGGLEMRGFPYPDRRPHDVAVQYGGWHGVLDYDAATQLAAPRDEEFFKAINIPVPKGAAATCCIMNTAWKIEYTPIMWQLPMLDGRYNRVGDIWSGHFIKKTLDALESVMIINGMASVRHERASNVYNSIVKEAPSVEMNDNLWYSLSNPTSYYMTTAYRQVTDSAYEFFLTYDKKYAEHFKKARDEWLSLFQ